MLEGWMGPQFVSAVEGMIEDFDASRETIGDGVNVNHLIGEWLAKIPRIDPTWQRDGAVATARLTLSAARSHRAAAQAFAKAAVSKMLTEHLYEGVLCRWVDHERESIVFGMVPRPGGEPGVSFYVVSPDDGFGLDGGDLSLAPAVPL